MVMQERSFEKAVTPLEQPEPSLAKTQPVPTPADTSVQKKRKRKPSVKEERPTSHRKSKSAVPELNGDQLFVFKNALINIKKVQVIQKGRKKPVKKQFIYGSNSNQPGRPARANSIPKKKKDSLSF